MNNSKFNKLYNNYKPLIKQFLKQGWRLSNEDIEEILDDVMLIAYKKCCNPLFIFNKSYIYTTTRNRAIDYLRKNKIHSENDQFIEDACAEISPEQMLLDSEERKFINNFLNGLKSVDRKISFLFYSESLTCKEIGRVLSIPTGTVKYKLHTIREKLTKEYNKYENGKA